MSGNGNGNGRKVKGKPSSNGGTVRGPDGKWVKGNPGGPGNPLAGTMAQNRAHMIQSIQPGDIEDCLETLLDILRDSDQPATARIQAADKLLSYACGKPKESVELTGTFTLAEFYSALGSRLLAS